MVGLEIGIQKKKNTIKSTRALTTVTKEVTATEASLQGKASQPATTTVTIITIASSLSSTTTTMKTATK